MKADFRVQEGLKSLIEELAKRSQWTISEVASELAWVGIGVKEEGGIEIIGPLGFTRPFSTWDFGGRQARLTLWIEKDLAKRLRKEFGESLRSALREAIHLGTIAFKPKEVKIKGPVFGMDRPLASVESPALKNERSREALRKLQSIPLH